MDVATVEMAPALATVKAAAPAAAAWPAEVAEGDKPLSAASPASASPMMEIAAANEAAAADDPDTHWNERFDAVLASGQAKGDYNRKPANPIGPCHSLPLCPSFPL